MSAKFWWIVGGVSSGAGLRRLEVLDLGRPISGMVEPELDALISSAESLDGQESIHALRRRTGLTIRFEDESSHPTWLGLRALVNHLKRGGRCGFALDADKAVAGHTLAAVHHTDSSFEYTPHWLLDVYGLTTKVLASGDEIVIRSNSPEYREEVVTVTSSSPSVGFNPPIVQLTTYVFGDGTTGATRAAFMENTFWRSEGFYPLLRMTEEGRSQQCITSDHRISFNLQLPLVEDLAVEAFGLPAVGAFPGIDDIVTFAGGA